MTSRLGAWGGLRLGFGSSRVPVILQTEGAECGLACLAMVAAAHGHRSDLPTLRQRFSLSLKGLNLLDLVRMAESLNLHARALRAEIEDLAQLEHPCILHWDMNHFVVLVGVSRGVATIHDPAHGVRRLKLEQVSRHFTGVVLELTPAADFVPRTERQHVSPRQMLGRVSGLKRSLAQIFALALALEAFVLLSPFLMQWVVDDVLVSADRDLLVTLGIGFGLLVLIQAGTAAIRSWAVLVLSATLNLQWLVERVRAPDAPAGGMVREAPHRRHLVALLRRAADPEDADHQLHRGRARRPAGGADAGDDVRLQRHADGGGAGRGGRLCAAALGLLPAAARGHRRGAGARVEASPATSSNRCAACRRSSCSTPRPTGSRASPAWWWTR